MFLIPPTANFTQHFTLGLKALKLGMKYDVKFAVGVIE
jgi:hypothetical protein